LVSFNTEFKDQDLRDALNRAMRTVGLAALIGLPIIWLAWGWQSVALFAVGAAIAATGILEWRQLMSAVLARLAAGDPARPMGPVIFWFFLRLVVAGALLYVSLKSLDGRISALIVGLALAMLALLIEAIRLFHSWSV
jgi:hypothetical protein